MACEDGSPGGVWRRASEGCRVKLTVEGSAIADAEVVTSAPEIAPRSAQPTQSLPAQARAYDELLALGVADPAVVCLSGRWFVGRWEQVRQVAQPRLTTGPQDSVAGRICSVGKVAIVVLGEGDALDEAMVKARARLAGEKAR